jgi:hypothetical protein
MQQVRNPVHLDFNRYRDLLLNLFCRAARPLRNHLDPCVSDVRIGFDGKPLKRDDAADE